VLQYITGKVVNRAEIQMDPALLCE